MSNDERNNNTRGRPFPHNFHFGTTLQNVFRNINHAFASNHDSSSGQHRDNRSRNRTGDVPPPGPVNSVGGAHDSRPTDSARTSAGSAVPSLVSAPAGIDTPSRSRLNSQRDDDEESIPELRSISDSSGESDPSIATVDPAPLHWGAGAQSVNQDRQNVQIDDEDEPPPLEPITGTRRARVEDDVDDARDRRHPSERVGGPPPSEDPAPQGANPQQPPHFPAGLFGAMFGLGPPGGNIPAGEALPEHVQTGEDTIDPSPTGNNATPGRSPHGVPILTAGFTLTIPLFGPAPGNRMGPAAGGQGVPQNMFGMDAGAREELFASFAALFQGLQAMEEGWEDPERAKKLVSGLEIVPLGLVKRLERVGGAPGGHLGDGAAEGSSSGCAICWDALLDGESDNFTGQQSLGDEAPRPSASDSNTAEAQNTTHTSNDVMDVDVHPSSDSHSEPNTSSTTPPSSESHNIISLPCAHVFHASCLLPWFTRAKQATCPTCRFNIDPENLTYTPPPRRAFNRAPPSQRENTAENPAPADPQAAPEAPATGAGVADAAVPPAAVPPGNGPSPAIGPGGVGFNAFAPIPGIPVFSFPAIQIPLRPTGAQAPEDGPQGIDVMTIGVDMDMFVGGLSPQERDANPRDNAADADGADNGGAGAGAAGGNGAANPNGLPQDLRSLIEGVLRTAQNVMPQVINAHGPAPPDAPATEGAEQPPPARPAPRAAWPQPPMDGGQPQPHPAPASDAAGSPPAGGPRAVPIFPFHPMMFRPTRSMPPRRERKTWTLPPAPGPSLRQRVEQREREKGLRCSDVSCGVGPSDDDPCPELSASLTKQVSIHPLPQAGTHESGVDAAVCTHAFHPSCLVSAERVAGWGGEDKAEPLVEVSCPVCRAVGCVTREEWESGVCAF